GTWKAATACGTSSTWPLPISSVTNTSPDRSAVTPHGFETPVNGSVTWLPHPLDVRGNSSTWMLRLSVIITSPAPSTATPMGPIGPVNGNATWLPYPLGPCGNSSTW